MLKSLRLPFAATLILHATFALDLEDDSEFDALARLEFGEDLDFGEVSDEQDIGTQDIGTLGKKTCAEKAEILYKRKLRRCGEDQDCIEEAEAWIVKRRKVCCL